MSLNKLLAVLCLSLWTMPLLGTPPAAWKQAFWIEKVTSQGQAVLYTYKSSKSEPVDLRYVEIWVEAADSHDPFGRMFWDRPDPSLELLRRGLARIKPGVSLPESYRNSYWNAERAAQKQRLGHWNSDKPDSSRPGYPWVTLIEIWGGLAAIIFPAGKLVLDQSRKKSFRLVLLGLGSAGKTWLWERIRNPDITIAELEQIEAVTTTSKSEPALRPKLMGKYEVTPVYVDTPGGRPGLQTGELLGRRGWILPRRTVWVLLCSTTPKTRVTRTSAESDKVDREYVAQQLGYLALPMGILSAPRTPKPRMVILVVAKSDLFCEHDPEHPNARAGKESLAKIFRDHIHRVEEACSGLKITFKLEFCSALEGWRTESIHRHIERALFPR